MMVQALYEEPVCQTDTTLVPLRVLVVEDNLANQKVAEGTLQFLGHEVVLANNGQEALDLYNKETFDVILMDIHMPVMDGVEATRQIRQIEQSNGTHVPIIAITAYAMSGDREKFLSMGVDEYVAKPFKREQLVEALRKTVSHEPEDS
jgi:CheY-like chemotaxis protein